jgi:hypothetical protein
MILTDIAKCLPLTNLWQSRTFASVLARVLRFLPREIVKIEQGF